MRLSLCVNTDECTRRRCDQGGQDIQTEVCTVSYCGEGAVYVHVHISSDIIVWFYMCTHAFTLKQIFWDILRVLYDVVMYIQCKFHLFSELLCACLCV